MMEKLSKFMELSSETCIVTKYVFDLERSIISPKILMIKPINVRHKRL